MTPFSWWFFLLLIKQFENCFIGITLRDNVVPSRELGCAGLELCFSIMHCAEWIWESHICSESRLCSHVDVRSWKTYSISLWSTVTHTSRLLLNESQRCTNSVVTPSSPLLSSVCLGAPPMGYLRGLISQNLDQVLYLRMRSYTWMFRNHRMATVILRILACLWGKQGRLEE